MPSILPAIRRTAPKLSRSFFVCRQCTTKPLPLHDASIRSYISKNIRFNSSAAAFQENVATAGSRASPLSSLAENISAKSAPAKAKFFPQTSSKGVAYWLLGSAASVFGLVVFGGLTRLTESGLSITEWKPITGSLPPLSAEDWASEFNLYKASPEFRLLNPHMTLDEFKKIYYMEWGHRQWGRFVGMSFVLPAIFFVATRRVSAPMSLRLLGISTLIGFQGAIGWWMVKSGLKDDLFAPGSHPRVSQYRLTTHLGTAFICYSAMLWNALAILRDNKLLRNPTVSLQEITHLKSAVLSPFRKSVAALTLLVFVTVMSGGLVAGLDAGLIYNEFPYMGLGLTPPKTELFDEFYSHRPDKSDLWWRNMLENPSTVQLDHRILATTTFTTIMSLFLYTRFSPAVSKALPSNARKGMLGVVHLVSLQVILGISTLIYMVPIHLAAAHQAGSLLLLSGTLLLGSRLWVPASTRALVAKRAQAMTARTLPRKGVDPNLQRVLKDLHSKGKPVTTV